MVDADVEERLQALELGFARLRRQLEDAQNDIMLANLLLDCRPDNQNPST